MKNVTIILTIFAKYILGCPLFHLVYDGPLQIFQHSQ